MDNKVMLKKSAAAAVCLIALLVTGCDDYTAERSVTDSTGREYDIICIDGVEYLQRFAGFCGFQSPHYKQDGSLFLCKERP